MVTEDGKRRSITIGTFAREEDAARAFDRVSIAKIGLATPRPRPTSRWRSTGRSGRSWGRWAWTGRWRPAKGGEPKDDCRQ